MDLKQAKLHFPTCVKNLQKIFQIILVCSSEKLLRLSKALTAAQSWAKFMCQSESFLPNVTISSSVSVNTFCPNWTHTFGDDISSLVISSTITGFWVLAVGHNSLLSIYLLACIQMFNIFRYMYISFSFTRSIHWLLEISNTSFFIVNSLRVLVNDSLHGTSNPPWGKSRANIWGPVTVHKIIPPWSKNNLLAAEIWRWTTVPTLRPQHKDPIHYHLLLLK